MNDFLTYIIHQKIIGEKVANFSEKKPGQDSAKILGKDKSENISKIYFKNCYTCTSDNKQKVINCSWRMEQSLGFYSCQPQSFSLQFPCCYDSRVLG